MIMSVKLFVILLILGGAFAAGCAGDKVPLAETPPPPGPIADDDLSYRNEPLLTEAGAPKTVFAAPDPGDSALPERAFENAPPVIPHNVDGLLPITTAENACAECHLPEAAADVGATSVPASHLYDLRRDTELQGLAGANYNCTQCHTPQADTGELVENTFSPYYRAREQKERSNLLDILNEGVK
jgi:cytochrome c-type protein NapB